MRAAAWWPGADAGRLAGGVAARSEPARVQIQRCSQDTSTWLSPARAASSAVQRCRALARGHGKRAPPVPSCPPAGPAGFGRLAERARRWALSLPGALLRRPVALLRAPLGSGDWQRGQRGGHSHFPFLSTTRLSCHLAAGGRKGRGGGRGDVERRVAPYGLLAVDDARRLAGVAAARSEPARFQIQRDQKTFVSVRRGASGRAGRVGQAGRRIGRGGWWDTWLQQ